MIQDPIEMAQHLAYLVEHGLPRDEVAGSEPRRVAGLVPEAAVFLLTTIEGRRFRVTVAREDYPYLTPEPKGGL